MKLNQEPPSDKQVLDIAALEVFLKGLHNHCCLFRGALKPPLFSFGSALCVALESSRRLDVQSDWTSCPVGLDNRESDGAGGSIAARQRTTHTVKLGSFKKWRQWQTPASFGSPATTVY